MALQAEPLTCVHPSFWFHTTNRGVSCGACGKEWGALGEALAERASRQEGPRARARGAAEGARVDPAKCDHDVRCGKCGTRWPAALVVAEAAAAAAREVVHDAAAIRAALEDTVE